MKNYTIFVHHPLPVLAEKCVRNSAGQYIYFDGKLNEIDAKKIADLISRYAANIQVFKGKYLGKLVYETNRIVRIGK